MGARVWGVGDDPLLDDALAGNPDWTSIYMAHRAGMLAAARAALGADHRARGGLSAEDAVSVAMAEVIKSGIPPGTRSLAAHLRTVAARRAIDIARRTRRQDDGVLDLDELPSGDDIEEQVTDSVAVAEAVDAVA